MNHTGLGDTLEFIFRKTGIQSVIYWLSDVFDFDCGCEARRIYLNRKFNYRKMKNFFRRVAELFARNPLLFAMFTASVWFVLIALAVSQMPTDDDKTIAAIVGVGSWLLFTAATWKLGSK